MTYKATTPPLTGAELDKLEALARAADRSQLASGPWIALASALNPRVILALIAQARAAQPESAAAPKDTPESMAESNARFAIDGAIQYGRENRNAPPSADHWLYEYWNIGQQLRELGKTGWDNVTPLASQPPARSSCTSCDGSGTVHRADGEYMGECPCAGSAPSATGTTGAIQSIDTLEFRNLLGDMLDAYRKELQGGPALQYEKARPKLIAHIDAIIGDLRAQLAAKGQDSSNSPEFEGIENAAPASAQPADELDHGETVLRVQEALGITRTGWVSPDVIMLRIEQLQKASAQPDRGAAQGGLAKVGYFIREGGAWVATSSDDPRATTLYRKTDTENSASPASQPVAPDAAHADESPMDRLRRNDPEFVAHLERTSEMVETWPKWKTGLYAPAAVAPSDAKGKADAANAGGLESCAFCGAGEPVLMPNEGPQGIGRSIGHPHTDTHYVHCDNCGADGPAHLTEYEARSAWNSRNSQSPATSAADAKDAEMWRFIVRDGCSLGGKFTLVVCEGGNLRELHGREYEPMVRAAMAAAPVAKGEPGPWNVLGMEDMPDPDRKLDVVLTNGVTEYNRNHSQIDWTQVADWRYSQAQSSAKGGDV